MIGSRATHSFITLDILRDKMLYPVDIEPAETFGDVGGLSRALRMQKTRHHGYVDLVREGFDGKRDIVMSSGLDLPFAIQRLRWRS